jgi:hypothetical protein
MLKVHHRVVAFGQVDRLPRSVVVPGTLSARGGVLVAPDKLEVHLKVALVMHTRVLTRVYPLHGIAVISLIIGLKGLIGKLRFGFNLLEMGFF